MSTAQPVSMSGRWWRATAYECTDRTLRGELDELWSAVKGGQIGLARRHALTAEAWAVRVHAERCDRGGDRAQRCTASLAAAKASRAQRTPQRVLVSSYEARGFLRCASGRFWSAVQVDDRGGAKEQLLIIAAVASRLIAPRSKASA